MSKKAFYLSGGNGSVMQVWTDSGGLIHDLDSVTEAGDVDIIHHYQDEEWDKLDWQPEPYACSISIEELEEYVGA